MSPRICCCTFSPDDLAERRVRDDSPVRSVIAVKQNERVFFQAQLVDRIYHSSNDFVHVSDHVGEVFGVSAGRSQRRVHLFFDAPVFAARRRNERPVRQRHRVINKERFVVVAVPLHEVVNKFDPDVLAVLPFGVRTKLSVLKDYRVGIPRPFVFRVSCVPQRVLIEARIPDLHSFIASQFRSGIIRRVVTLQLPFASNARAVAGVFHPVPERFGFGIQAPEVQPVAIVVEPCHQLNASVRAQRLSIRMSEPLPFRRNFVQPRGSITGPAITVQTFHSDVICHDDNDVGAAGSLCGIRR